MVVNGAANRRKGHNFERYLVKIFRDDLGFKFCKTSRQASRLLDDSKVDLAFIPYNVQAKSVKSNLNYQEIFKSMDEALEQNFPPTDQQVNLPKLIFHKKGRKKYESLVIVEEKEFIKILNQLHNGSK